MRLRLFLLAALTAVFCPLAAEPVPNYTYRVLHVYPHDPTAFTQGLEFHDGFLYEGTGLEGRSTLRKEILESGKVVEEIELAPQLFGEGITVLGGRIVQLTWLSHIGFVYDQASFRRIRDFTYPGEGWGLTNDGHHLYMSDGSSQIRCLDPNSFEELRRFTVHHGTREIKELNELEWVRGEIYANIWQTDRIARIAPEDGRVVGWIDLTGLLPAADRTAETNVLNGIAYDATRDRLFVTGKLWPKLFEIRLIGTRRSQ